MAKTNQNFTHWKGDSKIISVTVDDTILLSGGIMKWAMSVDAQSDRLITKSSPTDITFEANVASFPLNSADTGEASGIAAGTYYHEWRYWNSGKGVVVAIGSVEIKNVINKT